VCEGSNGRYMMWGNALEVTPSLYGIDFLFDQRDPDGEISKLGWLIELYMQAMWADSL
jgi:hypothetical protein